MTITARHRARLKALHESNDDFGVIGNLWSHRVVAYIRETKSRSYLDYGSGRSKLIQYVQEDLKRLEHPCVVSEYEPAFGDKLPAPADFVTCIDVLEHVEKLMLESVLLDLKRVARKAALITVSLRNSANKGTHPIVRSREWWIHKSQKHLGRTTEIPILNPDKAKSEVAMLVETK